MRRRPAGEVLTRRKLNRATLARQLLLERAERPALDVVHHLVGMQAQVPTDPYVGLWSRLERFEPDELSHLVLDRSVVRMGVMRTTLHLVTADDALALRAFTQSVLERAFWKGSPFARHVVGMDVEELLAEARSFIEERPATSAQLARHLGERWPERDATAFAYTVRFLEPIVQVPPRGVWGARHQATWTTVRAWLGRDVPPLPDDAAVVLRYLAAFGPASVQDIQTWCWRTKLAAVVEDLRPQLLTFRDEAGTELFDLPGAPRPDPDMPAPVRFLPEYDNVLLSHKDRSRFLVRRLAYDRFWHGNVLVDGMLRGTWRTRKERDGTTLQVRMFEVLEPGDDAAVHAEADRLLAFLGDGRGGAIEVTTG